MAHKAFWALPEALLATLRHGLPEKLAGFFDLLGRIASLGPRDRHEPVKVRVSQPLDLVAPVTLAAGCLWPVLAEQALGHPKRQALLPHPRWTDQQGRLRKPAGGKCATQPVQQGLMTIDWSYTHRRTMYSIPVVLGTLTCVKSNINSYLWNSCKDARFGPITARFVRCLDGEPLMAIRCRHPSETLADSRLTAPSPFDIRDSIFNARYSTGDSTCGCRVWRFRSARASG